MDLHVLSVYHFLHDEKWLKISTFCTNIMSDIPAVLPAGQISSDGKSLHQPAELSGSKGLHIRFRAGPDELSVFKPFI